MPLAPLVLAVKLGLYASAMLAAGLGLQASANIVDRGDPSRVLRSAALLACTTVIVAALRLAHANAQLGESITSIIHPAALSWTSPVIAPSSIALALGARFHFRTPGRNQFGIRGRTTSEFAGAGFALTGHTQAYASPSLAPWGVGLDERQAGQPAPT
jgi:hypothetical protein